MRFFIINVDQRFNFLLLVFKTNNLLHIPTQPTIRMALLSNNNTKDLIADMTSFFVISFPRRKYYIIKLKTTSGNRVIKQISSGKQESLYSRCVIISFAIIYCVEIIIISLF